MIAGTLEIQLMANMARLSKDIAEAKRTVGEGMEQIKRSAEMATKALELLGVGLGVREFGEMIKNVLETSRRLGELSQQLGVSVRDIAGYRLAAAETGTSLEAVATSIKKFSTFMVEHNDLLQKAGVTATTATEGLNKISDIFHALPDGVEKTALAVKLFGKNGVEMIPMLNQGSEKLEEQRMKAQALAEEYEKLAPKAHEFNETLQELKMDSEAAAINIAGPLVDALKDAIEQFIKGKEIAGSFGESIRLFGWGISPLNSLAENLKKVRDQLDALNDAKAKLTETHKFETFNGQVVSGADLDRLIADAKKQLEFLELQQRQAALKNNPSYRNEGGVAPEGMTAAEAKAKADALIGPTEEAKKAKEAYDALIKSIKEKIAVEQAELDAGRPLTAAEKERAESEAKIQALMKQYPGYSHAEAQAVAELENAKRGELDQQRASEELYAKAAERQASAFDANEKEIEQIVNSTATLREENANLSLGAAAMDDLKIKRIDDAIAREQQTLAIMDGLDQDSAEIKQIRDKIKALQDLKQATGENITAHALEQQAQQWKQFMGEIDRGLTDALLNGFEGGKDAAKNFIDSMKHMLETAALKVVIQALINPTLNSAAQAAGINTGSAGQSGGLFGGGGVPGVPGFGVGSLVSGFGNLIGSSSISAFGTGMGLSAAAATEAAGSYTAAAAALTAAGDAAGAASMTATASSLSLGSTIGAALPYVGAAIALYSLFAGGGKDDPHNNASYTGLSLSLSQAGVGNSIGRDPYMFTAGATSGKGWWAENTNLNSAQTDAINKQVASIFTGGTSLAKMLGVDPSVLKDVSVDSATSGTAHAGLINSFASVDAAMTALSDKIATALIPNIASFQQSGETLSQTIQRIVGDIQGFDAIAQHLGMTLNLTGDASTRAASIENIIAQGGGSQTFSSNLQAFYQGFYSDAERQASAVKDLQTAFDKLGVAMPATKEGFRALVTGLDLNTAAGQSLFGQLIALAPAFAQVADAAGSVGAAIGDLTSQISDAQKAAVDAINSQISLSQTAASTAHQAADAYRALTQSLSDAMTQLKLSDLSPYKSGDKLTVASQSLDQVFAKAMSGDQTALGDLPKVAQDFLTASRAFNSSSDAYTADFQRVMQMLAQAQGASGGAAAAKDYQATLLDMQTNLLGQIKDELAQTDPNTALLAQQATLLQTIGGLMTGQYASILTGNAIQDAIRNISANDSQVTASQLQALVQGTAIQTDQFTAMVQGTNMTVSLLKQLVDLTTQMLQVQINGLYQSILGRTSDTSGLQYWTNQAVSGTSIATISQAIAASPEAQARTDIGAIYQSVLHRSADEAGLQYWTAKDMGGMSLADITAAIAASPEAQALIPGHANGLHRVMHDNYLMRAHKDEAVLTAPQADKWRRGESGITGGDLAGLQTDIRELRSGLNNLNSTIRSGNNDNVDATEGVSKTIREVAYRTEAKPEYR